MAFNNKINLEELSQDDERLRSSQTGFLDQFVAMPSGDANVKVRILPPGEGGKLYQYNRVHSINGRKVHCPRPLRNGRWDKSVPCPICDYYAHLWTKADKCEAAGRKEEATRAQEEARQLKPLERYYYNVIVRSMAVNGELQKNVGPRILSVGKDLHGKILKGILGDADGPGLGNVADLLRGHDFIIKKQVVGGFPRYSDSKFATDRSPAGTQEEVERWGTSLHDLEALRNPKPVAELEKELAIHRKLIPDTVAFDETAFDAKFKAPIPLETATAAPAAEVTEPQAPESLEIKALSDPEGDEDNESFCVSDDDFVRQIREMERGSRS